jgi:methylated-DNA-protein-cysteine methyltransferase-like protein
MPRISFRSTPIPMTPFTLNVLELIKAIPCGRVSTYGQIAALAGKPGSPRAVGWILHSCTRSHKLPWQRVINSQGRISFPMRRKEFKEQKKLLSKESVEVSDRGQVDLGIYGWKKKARSKATKREPQIFR